MKKFLLPLLLCVVSIIPVRAQLNGNGFYRVQNAVTDRYAYITDDKGHVDAATTSVDALAIQLWKDINKACCDPATILYFESKGGVDYDILAQGTGVYKLVGYNVKIRTNSDGTYFAYGSQKGATKYLGDASSSDSPEGTMSTEATGDRRKWRIKPISVSGENYFGIKPTIKVGNKYYQPIFASFPMSAYSEGVVIRYIAKYGFGMAVAKTVSGTIPGNTACYIECATDSPSSNRMNVGGTGTAVADNQMDGVYFENYMKTHLNLTPYNRNTMRLLGVLSDGSLGFKVADIQYLPANRSYLKVPEGSPDEIRIVTEEEYDRVVSGLPVSVSLNSAKEKLYVGGQVQLSASVAPENATDKSLVWSSSDNAVATVGSDGLVRANAKGSAVITVKTINGKTAQCTVTVNPNFPESIAVFPATLKLYVEDLYQLTSTLTPSDVEHSGVSWSSSDPSTVRVDNAGKLTAIKTGFVTITARTENGKTASTSVTVNPVYPSAITLNTAERYIHAKETYQLTAAISPADVKDPSLLWSSADSNVASVDAGGKVTGNAMGSTVITVKSPGGVSASCKINVMAQMPEGVSMEFEELIMEVADVRSLRASVLPAGSYSSLKWSSSDNNVVTVSSIGQVTAVGEGKATVTATTANGIEARCSITVLPKGIPATSIKVNPNRLNLTVGQSSSLSVEILPENVTNRFVTWTSNNNGIVKVDKDGNVTAISDGVCILYAQCGSVSGTCTVVVAKPIPVSMILLDKENVVAEAGTEVVLTPTVIPSNATDKRLRWSSDNEDVASVSTEGKVSVRTAGNATVKVEAMDGNGASATCAVTATADIAEITADFDGPQRVCALNGTVLFEAASLDDLRSLAPGLYIIGNRKVLVR